MGLSQPFYYSAEFGCVVLIEVSCWNLHVQIYKSHMDNCAIHVCMNVCVREVDAHFDVLVSWETAQGNGTIVLLLPIFSLFFFSLDILVHFESKFALLFVHWELSV